jgi:hypothetical protein
MGRVRQHDPRGVARIPLRARRGGGEERSPLPDVAPFNLSGLIEAFNEGFSCLEIVHRCASFRPDALPTRSGSRGPGGRAL